MAATLIFCEQVAVGHRGGDLRDVAHLARQVVRHRVDGVGQVLPGAGDAGHVGLAAEDALGADLAGHAGDLGREGAQLVDHAVDGVGQGGDLALGVDRDLLREVAVGHRRGDLGDVAHLAGEVVGHRVDRVRQALPGARDARHLRLPAELALGAHLAGHAGDLGRERRQLVDHRVDGLLQLQDLAAGVDRDLLRQVAVGHRRRDLGDVAHLVGEVGAPSGSRSR